MTPYGALALRQNTYGQTETVVSDEELDAMQAELEVLSIGVEAAALRAGERISTAVAASRKYEAHRRFLYMVGAPAIVLSGLSNTRYPLIGLFSAAVGAYVGVKNYQDHKAAESGSYAGYGTVPLSQPKCIAPRKRGRKHRCPPGYRPRYRVGLGHLSCCRR